MRNENCSENIPSVNEHVQRWMPTERQLVAERGLLLCCFSALHFLYRALIIYISDSPHMTAINETSHQQSAASFIIRKINASHNMYLIEPVFQRAAINKQCSCGIGYIPSVCKIRFERRQIFRAVIRIIFMQQQKLALNKAAARVIPNRRFSHQLRQKYVRSIDTHASVKRHPKFCNSLGLPYIRLSCCDISKCH